MVQYWFDGPSVEINVKPHGNWLTGQPFFRTSESAKKRHREIAASNKPKDAMQIVTQECGGEMGAKGMQLLPRNIQQIKNYRRTGNTKDNACSVSTGSWKPLSAFSQIPGSSVSWLWIQLTILVILMSHRQPTSISCLWISLHGNIQQLPAPFLCINGKTLHLLTIS